MISTSVINDHSRVNVYHAISNNNVTSVVKAAGESMMIGPCHLVSVNSCVSSEKKEEQAKLSLHHWSVHVSTELEKE